jgi:hypothetical protein
MTKRTVVVDIKSAVFEWIWEQTDAGDRHYVISEIMGEEGLKEDDDEVADFKLTDDGKFEVTLEDAEGED